MWEKLGRPEPEDRCGEGHGQHHYHPVTQPIMMVLKDGFVLMKCCGCGRTKQVHRAHTHELNR